MKAIYFDVRVYNQTKIDMGGIAMPQTMQGLLEQYISEIKKIYGSHL